MEILISTSNLGKATEFTRIMAGLDVNTLSLASFGYIPPPEETGDSFLANAILKAKYYSGITGLAALADDSGLCVDALDGAPGIYSARYAGDDSDDGAKIDKLLTELSASPNPDRSARFVSAMALVSPDGEILYRCEGVCEGMITDEPRGSGGFGYDPIFVPNGYTQTFGELSAEIKDSISHRSLALAKINAYLRAFLSTST